MSDQLHIPAGAYPALPPVAVNGDALERFTLEMDRRLRDFDARFYVRRKHPRIEAPRHRRQPPRKPR